MSDWLEKSIIVIIFTAAIYFGIAATAFQFNNPKANDMQIYVHFGDVMHWRSLPEFQ